MPRAKEQFVGRAAELAWLVAALEGAVAGRGGTVLLAGEAGIGKTRLVRELSERARGAGALVLSGRCIDLVGAGMPYLAIVDALRPVTGLLRQDPPPAELSRLLPGLAGPGGSALTAGGGADVRARLFEEVRAVLDRLAAQTPLLLVLEDLHWADTSTLDLVSFLAHTVGESAVLVVATYRSDETRLADPLGRLVTGLVRARVASTVRLPGLPADELETLLVGVADEVVPAELAEAICTRAAGNPFFAEELLDAALRGEASLPPMLRDALLQRVARLDADSQAVLRIVAAAGRDAPYELLAAVTTLAGPRLQRALRQAVDHDVLLADQPAGTYRLRHALLAEAVYTTVLPGERETLHGALARALGDHPHLAAGAVAGELAAHWSAAGRPVEALPASLQAARDSEEVSGLAEALRHLEQALRLWPCVPSPEATAGRPLVEVLAHAAELADLTGDGQRAAQLVRRAIDLVDEEHQPVRVALLFERLGSYLLPTGERGEGLAACRRAVELIPEAPPSTHRARVLTTFANALLLSWHHAESRAACDAAIGAGQAAGDDRPAIRARGVLGLDLCFLGRPADGLARLRDAHRRARERGKPRDIAHTYALLCEALLVTGRAQEAASVALEGRATACRLGAERSFGVLLAAYAAEALLETGDWAGADDVLAAALRRGATFWGHYPHLVRTQLAIGRGDFQAARHHLSTGGRAAREPTSAPRHARLVTELALWEGRPEAAAAAAERGLRDASGDAAAFHRVRLSALALQAEAHRVRYAAVRGDRAGVDAARRRAGRLLERARGYAVTAGRVTPDAGRWLAVAEAEHGRVTGRPDPRQWSAAVAAWDAATRPYPAAYCRWRCAEAQLSAGTADATAMAREAHRVAVRLGADPLRQELELLALRARFDLVGLDPGQPPQARPALGLTTREDQVLRLVARGYTNRQIAGELTISVKTASVHVTNILRKLHVTSRVDAAAVAHQILPREPARAAPPPTAVGLRTTPH